LALFLFDISCFCNLFLQKYPRVEKLRIGWFGCRNLF